MSAKSRAKNRSRRRAAVADTRLAVENTHGAWSAIHSAREIVAARDDVLAWIGRKDAWMRGYGGSMRDQLVDMKTAQAEVSDLSPDTAEIANATPALRFAVLRGYIPDSDDDPGRQASETLEHIYRLHSNLFTLAEPYVISPDMHAVVEAASKTVEPEDVTTLTRDDVLTEQGILWLPEPVRANDSDIEVRLLSWTLRSFQDRPALIVQAWQHFPHNEGVPDLIECWSTIIVLAGERLLEQANWTNSFANLDIEAYVFAFLRLSAQRIIITPRLRDPDRFPGKPRPHEVVRVTRLRSFQAAATVESDHQPVEWQHRWLVKMHKVRQWYPSEGVHRVIFRGPFVKGPADKPLLAGEKVAALVR